MSRQWRVVPTAAARLRDRDPIPVADFLASWGLDPGLPEAPAELTGTRRAALIAAVGDWVSSRTGRRPDLAEAANKTLGTLVAAELRAALADRLGALTGDGDLGVDGIEVVTTRRSRPQAGVRYRSPSERVFGLGRHLVFVVFDIVDTDVLTVDSVLFVAASRTADARTSAAAERQRSAIAAGESTLVTAVEVLAGHGVPATAELVAALCGPDPIPAGVLRLSPAAEWRVRLGAAPAAEDLLAAAGAELAPSARPSQPAFDFS